MPPPSQTHLPLYISVSFLLSEWFCCLYFTFHSPWDMRSAIPADYFFGCFSPYFFAVNNFHFLPEVLLAPWMLLHSGHLTLIQDHLATSKNKAAAGDLSVLIFPQSCPIFNTFAVCLFPIPEKSKQIRHNIYIVWCA